jgi:serine-type D-Ala-D-Ala carboxypeptidase/endopeptidase (penicillin-binding protein 4)
MTYKRLFGIVYFQYILFLIFLFSIIPISAANKSNSIITASDSSKSLKSLVERLDEILSDKNLKNTKYSIAIYSLDRNESIYTKNANLSLTPASCTKLVTAFGIFSIFGSDSYVSTSLYHRGEIDNEGVLKGDLYIVGRGDALFNSSDLDLMTEALQRKGVKKVSGNIYADASYFDGIGDRLAYSGDADKVQDLQPISALSIEKNIANVFVTAGSLAGKPLNVQIIPSSSYFIKTVSATVRSVKKRTAPKKKTGKRKSDLLMPEIEYHQNNPLDYQHNFNQNFGDVPPAPLNIAYSAKGVSVASPRSKSNRQTINVSGTLAPNATYSYRHYIQNPALASAGALKVRLENAGISVSGDIAERKMIDKDSLGRANLLFELNRERYELISPMNKMSDNYIAENLFKMIGASSANNAHSSQEAKKLMIAKLKEVGIECKDCSFNDGSGLSRRNKISSDDLVKLLSEVYKTTFGRKIDSSLSIAGVDGTLSKRMIESPAQGNLRGKTGTHRNVSSLAGYVNTLDGELLAFSFIFNGGNVGAYKQIENQLGIALAEFFYYNEMKK